MDKTAEKISLEIGQIDRLFETYAALLEKVRHKEPDMVEITALASILHSFYNGLENVFLRIVKDVDGALPADSGWHRKLLARMTETTPNRGPVISAETSDRLVEYLGFRHFYRHSYSFFLDWDKLENLVIPLPEVWKQTKAEFNKFIEQIE